VVEENVAEKKEEAVIRPQEETYEEEKFEESANNAPEAMKRSEPKEKPGIQVEPKLEEVGV
jgi:hypothetical protein